MPPAAPTPPEAHPLRDTIGGLRRRLMVMLLATIAAMLRPKPALAPSELVTPCTASAASSAARARSDRVSVDGSTGSTRSSSGSAVASSDGSAMPQYGSSGTTLAMATARSTASSSAAGRRSEEEDDRHALADEDAQPQVAAFGALDMLELAEPVADRDRGAVEQHRVGGVGAGPPGLADQAGQQVEGRVMGIGHRAVRRFRGHPGHVATPPPPRQGAKASGRGG